MCTTHKLHRSFLPLVLILVLDHRSAVVRHCLYTLAEFVPSLWFRSAIRKQQQQIINKRKTPVTSPAKPSQLTYLYFQGFHLHTHALDARLVLLYVLFKEVNQLSSQQFFKTCDSRMVFCNSFLHKSRLVRVLSQVKKQTVLQRVSNLCSLLPLASFPSSSV